jgi:very-short-patch-repair endonuclease
MSYKRLKYTYRGSASKLHRAVGDAIRNHPSLKSLRSLQEYPIPHTPYHVDWFISDLQLAIECHGEQHERPVAFDGDKEKAEEAFRLQQKRDIKKKQLCLDQGWKFVEIWFNEDLSINAVAAKIISSL